MKRLCALVLLHPDTGTGYDTAFQLFGYYSRRNTRLRASETCCETGWNYSQLRAIRMWFSLLPRGIAPCGLKPGYDIFNTYA